MTILNNDNSVNKMQILEKYLGRVLRSETSPAQGLRLENSNKQLKFSKQTEDIRDQLSSRRPKQ